MGNSIADPAAALTVPARRPAEEHLAATAALPQAAMQAEEIRVDTPVAVLAVAIQAVDIQAAAAVHPAEVADIPVVEAVVPQVVVAAPLEAAEVPEAEVDIPVEAVAEDQLEAAVLPVEEADAAINFCTSGVGRERKQISLSQRERRDGGRHTRGAPCF
jgi:hypothetical protein